MAEKYGKVKEGRASSDMPDKNYAEATEEDEGLIEKIISFFTKGK